MGTDLETAAPDATLDFRDVVRNLEWWEEWPVCREAMAIVDSFRIENGQVIGTKVDVAANKVTLQLRAKATLREVVARGHLANGGGIVEVSPLRAGEFNRRIVEHAVPLQTDKL